MRVEHSRHVEVKRQLMGFLFFVYVCVALADLELCGSGWP